MKVVFIQADRCFVFYDLDSTVNEAKTIFVELSRHLMHHQVIARHEAKLMQGERGTLFTNHPVEGRRASHMGQTVELAFETDRGAMEFKLTFIRDDIYIPWEGRG